MTKLVLAAAMTALTIGTSAAVPAAAQGRDGHHFYGHAYPREAHRGFSRYGYGYRYGGYPYGYYGPRHWVYVTPAYRHWSL